MKFPVGAACAVALLLSLHAMKFAKYRQRYLRALQYRFNRRFRLQDIVGRLGNALMRAKDRPEHVLRDPAEIRR